jgi:hypothetical protein
VCSLVLTGMRSRAFWLLVVISCFSALSLIVNLIRKWSGMIGLFQKVFFLDLRISCGAAPIIVTDGPMLSG